MSASYAVRERFFKCVKKDDVETAKSYLQSDFGISTSLLDTTGKTPLFYAISNNSVSMLNTLLHYGFDKDAFSYVEYHRSNALCSVHELPIVTATRTGHTNMVLALVSAGANLDAQLEIRQRSGQVVQDRSALHIACEDGKADLVELLLKNNVNVNVEDKQGEIPLHKVVRCRDCCVQCELVRMLCEHGSDVNHTSKIGCNPLYLTAFYGCVKKTQILLMYGADCNQFLMRENSYGTPLHIAAANGHDDILKLLIQYGAKLNVKNSLQYTPLSINLASQSRDSCASILIYHGCHLHGTDKHNLTVMASIMHNMRLDCELLASTLVNAGYDLRHDTWLKPAHLQQNTDEVDDSPSMPRINIPDGRVRTLCDWLLKRQQNTCDLVTLCRTVIRGRIRVACGNTSIVPGIELLPLPNTIKDFLLLKDKFKGHRVEFDSALIT